MCVQGTTPDMTYTADALSSNTRLSASHFNSLHKYRLEWTPGQHGYLRWYLDDEFVYGIDSTALNLTGAVIPEEPMYLLLNTALSSTWGFPQPCPEGCACDCFDCRKPECECAIPYGMCSNFPAYFLIDYVRVYQAVGDDEQIVGCSTPTHPTSRYIKGHESKYMAEGDKLPLQPIAQGGAGCTQDAECGMGTCARLKCMCNKGYEGPHCLVRPYQLKLKLHIYKLYARSTCLPSTISMLLVNAHFLSSSHVADPNLA